jgi:Protein chain release factor B
MKNRIIPISNEIFIDTKKIKFKPILSSGPGGQNINKNSTAVLLQYSLLSKDLPYWFLKKIKIKYRKKISNNNTIFLKVNNSKSQIMNKKEAINRLIEIFKDSSQIKEKRKKTIVPFRTKIHRLNQKKIHSIKKKVEDLQELMIKVFHINSLKLILVNHN